MDRVTLYVVLGCVVAVVAVLLAVVFVERRKPSGDRLTWRAWLESIVDGSRFGGP